ncbi:Krueppel-like factor 15 [Lates japonicus]|uniref:Krueppel-like factor 15 n=1 Tax=Lates japonicus TaxID=270547 RepID=A0AAD3RLE2_LATJO|nr:Krueppel-like factor 15 [Lates japonicus]
MVDHLPLGEETFLYYTGSPGSDYNCLGRHANGGVSAGIMVTDACIYHHHHHLYQGVTVSSSPRLSEDDLSDSSSPRSSLCSSPESSSPTSRHVFGSSYETLMLAILLLPLYACPLHPSLPPRLSLPPFCPWAWPGSPKDMLSLLQQQTKEDCYEFPVFLDELHDPAALLFQPTLEEIEEFLEENMVVEMEKEEEASDEAMSPTSEDTEAEGSRTLQREPVSVSQNSDQTVPVAHSPLSSYTETKHSPCASDMDSSPSTVDTSCRTSSSSSSSRVDGIKQEDCGSTGLIREGTSATSR